MKLEFLRTSIKFKWEGINFVETKAEIKQYGHYADNQTRPPLRLSLPMRFPCFHCTISSILML